MPNKRSVADFKTDIKQMKLVNNNTMLGLVLAVLNKLKLDAMVVPMADNHLNEFISKEENVIEFLTGFSGSAGTAIVFRDGDGGLLTDGRYYEQAEKQLFENFTLLKREEITVTEYLEKRPGVKRVGIPAEKISHIDYQKFEKELKERNISLAKIEDIFDTNKKRVFNKIIDINEMKYSLNKTDERALEFFFKHILADRAIGEEELRKLNVSGRTRREKLKMVRKAMEGFDALIVTELDTISWIYNIRSSDIEYNAVQFSYSIITPSEAYLYLGKSIELDNDVVVRKYWEFLGDLEEYKNGKVAVSGECNAFIGGMLKNAEFISEIREMQTTKTPSELYGMFRGNIQDSAAITSLFSWLAGQDSASEREIAEKLLEFKKRSPEFVFESFKSIVGIGPNSAEIHHEFGDKEIRKGNIKRNDAKQKDANNNKQSDANDKQSDANSNNQSDANDREKDANSNKQNPETSEKSDAPQDPESKIVLLDTGSHYLYGTTDTTRAISFEESEKERKYYTAVLKACIRARLVGGSNGKLSGLEVDSTARKLMKKAGRNYNTATGHGVGAGLNVHESPPTISTRESLIEYNQVFSIEPGYYEPGAFGIRIEDVVYYRSDNRIVLLDYVPLHLKLIDKALLEEDEISEINRYNELTYELMSLFVTEEGALKYLRDNTKEL